MVLDTLFSQRLRPVTIVSLVILGVGLIGQLITTAVWWSRIHPWFSYGRGIYRIVYNNVCACWILSLIAFILLAFYAAIDIFAKDLFEKLTGSLGGTIGVITAIGLFSLAGLIPGAYASSYALDRYHLNIDEIKKDILEEKIKIEDLEGVIMSKLGEHLCEGYFFLGVMELSEKMKEKGPEKYAKYVKWYAKIKKHAFIPFPIPIPDAPDIGLKSYMCETVGVPTIIFTMLTGLAIIMFFYIIIVSAYRSPGDKSEGEA